MKWKFRVCKKESEIPLGAFDTAYLVRDRWNDYGFGTQFSLYVRDKSGELIMIGYVKIGRAGMKLKPGVFGTLFTEIDDNFSALGNEYFSVGQDREYYENLIKILGRERASALLISIRDVTFHDEAISKFGEEEVFTNSLFRSITTAVVTDQYRRIIQGGVSKEFFSLRYSWPEDRSRKRPVLDLEFEVHPDSYPPTNVHVLIGSNGAGKTRALKGLAASMSRTDVDGSGRSDNSIAMHKQLTSLVSISFSAFDIFSDEMQAVSNDPRKRVQYVGLQHPEEDRRMSPQELKSVFSQRLNACLVKGKRERLTQVFRFIERDPGLAGMQISDLNGIKERLNFDILSSGHKIVLLTLVSLVDLVEEKTLVLIDEPESHLHPPLIAAFTRALSWLLADRNGVAVLATHSPVILQEVPRSCVWKISASGAELRVDRPSLETFGENLGVLNREVFMLEIEQTGYHEMLAEVASRSSTYDLAVAEFQGSLGQEAKSVLRVLMISKDRQSHK
ncbi:hypothetical protein GCM10011577_39460 [Pseudarthrobacter polychromogenes]|uniref:ATPase AAA-type core domain-containing protein n=2 Tax=Pseudarthrobacter polychromogenes TaxID=1676 RepID=A0ABQ1Y3S3_9MICC|nr:hypothetical protein GCM10011577_39460 [Pseudarthrobacter polychromogenes]